MLNTQDTTDKRDAKAQILLDAGKVRLVIGQRFGHVDGSNGESYRVGRDFCECADWLARHPEGGCCHQRALRAACREYKALREQARNGETVRPSVGLLKALGWLAAEADTRPALVPAGAERDRNGIAYCLRCGSDLTPDGRCPRHDARLRELGYEVMAA